jgi:hypothetical protein
MSVSLRCQILLHLSSLAATACRQLKAAQGEPSAAAKADRAASGAAGVQPAHWLQGQKSAQHHQTRQPRAQAPRRVHGAATALTVHRRGGCLRRRLPVASLWRGAPTAAALAQAASPRRSREQQATKHRCRRCHPSLPAATPEQCGLAPAPQQTLACAGAGAAHARGLQPQRPQAGGRPAECAHRAQAHAPAPAVRRCCHQRQRHMHGIVLGHRMGSSHVLVRSTA